MTEALAIPVGDLVFPALAAGSGPVVLCLHGFPDGPETWHAQLPVLAETGYRAVAVTSRGYAPSCLPANGDFHVETLVRDVVGIIDALGEDRVHLLGHDWGATIAYAMAALAPERVLSLTTVAVPHPGRMFAVAAGDAEQLALYDYTQLFQILDAEHIITAEDFAYLEALWRRWSPDWDVPVGDIAAMKERMGRSGVAAAALQYYRQATDVASETGQRSLALLLSTIAVPTLGIAGTGDRCNLVRTMRAGMLDDDFPRGVRLAEIAGVGHFPHRERADIFNAVLLDWLGTRNADD